MMIKLKKRKKTSRIRGARTCGFGFRQKHRGKGDRGGVGLGGSGAQKRQSVLMKAGGNYFGRRGVTSRPNAKKRENVMNLEDIKKNHVNEKEIKLGKYKILGKGDGLKIVIYAKQASKSAIEKMEKAGGKIILVKDKEVRKEK